jgi:hypothetical protein
MDKEENKDLKDQREQMEILVLMDFRAQEDPPEIRVQLEMLVQEGLMETKE